MQRFKSERVNPYPAKVIYYNFQLHEVVPCYRDLQPQVVERDQTFVNLDVYMHISFSNISDLIRQIKP